MAVHTENSNGSEPDRAGGGGPGLRFGGAILAGGRATRYSGMPKGLLETADGLPIVSRTVREMRAAGLEDIAIVANEPAPYAPLGLPVVGDLRPGAGPLSGIETALTRFEGGADAVLVLPSDLPGITAAQIEALLAGAARSEASVVVAATRNREKPDEKPSAQPLCAAVRLDVLPTVRQSIDRWLARSDATSGGAKSREVGVGRLWRELGAETVEFDDPWPFFNVNSPEDMARWLDRERRRGSR